MKNDQLQFNLKAESAKLGYDVRNMSANSGFLGRAGDEVGIQFGRIVDDL